jgi:hypothetical protein
VAALLRQLRTHNVDGALPGGRAEALQWLPLDRRTAPVYAQVASVLRARIAKERQPHIKVLVGVRLPGPL